MSGPTPPGVEAGSSGSDPEPGPSRRRPPSLAASPQYPVTTAVALTAAGVTVASWLGWFPDPLLMDARAWDGQLWRLPASALPHIDIIHLAFNLYWLWVFGTAVEGGFGSRATAGIYLLLAVGSAAAQYALDAPGVGLSGIGYGLFGLLLVLRRDPRFAGVVTGQVATLFVGWFVFCWLMTRAGNWQVGNAAHASGAILGAVLGLAVLAQGGRRALAATALVGLTALALIGAAVRTPGPAELARLGYYDLEAGRHQRAADRLEQAVAADPDQADWWVNLAVARWHLGQDDRSIDAYREALRRRPQDREVRAALAGLLSQAGYRRHTAGDLLGAERNYRESLELDDRAGGVWYNLGLIRQQSGETDAARTAFRRAIELNPADENSRTALASLPAE